MGINMNLSKWALEGLTSEQQVDVLKSFYEAAGKVAEASQQPMELGAGIAIAGFCLGSGLAAYAYFRYRYSKG